MNHLKTLSSLVEDLKGQTQELNKNVCDILMPVLRAFIKRAQPDEASKVLLTIVESIIESLQIQGRFSTACKILHVAWNSKESPFYLYSGTIYTIMELCSRKQLAYMHDTVLRGVVKDPDLLEIMIVGLNQSKEIITMPSKWGYIADMDIMINLAHRFRKAGLFAAEVKVREYIIPMCQNYDKALAYDNAAMSCYRIRDGKRAIDYAEKALDVVTTKTFPHMHIRIAYFREHLAQCLHKFGDQEQQRQAASLLLDVTDTIETSKTQDPLTLYRCARALHTLGKTKEALEILKTALSLCPQNRDDAIRNKIIRITTRLKS